MAADRACAWVLPGLLGKMLGAPQRSMVETAFAAALTHAIDEVQWYCTWGIAEQLWPIDHSLTMRCINALAMEAALIEKERRVQQTRP